MTKGKNHTEPISRLKINIVEARVDNMKNRDSQTAVKLYDPYVQVDYNQEAFHTPSKLDLLNKAKNLTKKDLKKGIVVN